MYTIKLIRRGEPLWRRTFMPYYYKLGTNGSEVQLRGKLLLCVHKATRAIPEHHIFGLNSPMLVIPAVQAGGSEGRGHH